MYDITKLSKQINPREDIKSFNSKIVIDILSTLVMNLDKILNIENKMGRKEGINMIYRVIWRKR